MKENFEILSETCSRYPDKTALVFGNESLTFAELQTRMGQVAAALRADGITAGNIVPILLPRGIDPIAALFGVWQLGAVACLLDSTYPAERLQAIRQDCGTDFLIDSDWLQKAYRQTGSPCYGSFGADDLAMIVFTSGSTGRPKGVMLPCHAVTSVVQNYRELFQVDDIFLCANPLSFVATLFTVIAPLTYGITVHIADDITRKDVTLFADYVRKHNISAAFVPPAMAPGFLQLADGQLRILFTGSERVRNIYSEKTKCYCLYGASETAAGVTSFAIDQPYANTPIGYAMPGTRFYLLDENDQLVEQGETGEICISGQIALGYLNRPELTAERFIPNPFAEGENDKTLFRSNDLGRLLPNGALEYVNRKDWMIKVRGNRVEPGEIETVMLESASLEKAVVVGFSDKSGEQKLYGCYTAKEPVDPAMLRERIALKLPEYMLPAFLEQVVSLPVNLNGKIDRTKITPPDLAQYQADYAAPTNEKERQLCNAFAKVLGLPQVGIHDDFVRLGGDSASAVEVQLLLPKTMQISGAALTSLRTPKRIAQEGLTETIPIAADRKEWKVTYDELGYIRSERLAPQTAGNVINVAFSLSGNLDVEKLERTLRQLLRKHRVLRSVYHQDSAGNFFRTLKDVPETVLQCIRCEKENALEEFQKRNTPFDLTEGPLYRFFLFEMPAGQHILCCSLFHSLLDGPGMQILWDEIAARYSGTFEESSERVPDFLDFAEWRETNPRFVSDQEFYRQMFHDGFNINKMPWRTPFQEPMPGDGVLRNRIETNLLEKGARHYGMTVFSSITSAFGLALGKYCQSNDVVLTLVVNARFANVTLKSTIGLFLDHVPIRLRWEKDQPLSEFLKTTDDLLTKVLSHQACSGREWMKAALPEYDPDLLPIVAINYRREMSLPAFQGLQAEPFPIPLTGVPRVFFSMMGIMHQTAASLNVSFLYPTYYFDTDAAEGMNQDFAHVLQKIAEGNDVAIADL